MYSTCLANGISRAVPRRACHAASVLLRGLDVGTDDPHAVRVGDEVISTSRLVSAATAAAADVAGASAVVLHAEPTIACVVAIVACLLAGVPVVPVAPDA